MTLHAICLLLLCLLAAPSHAGDNAPPRLMLATSFESGVAVPDYWISEKLDGVRGHWDGRRLRTRGGYRIDPPAWFTAGWPDVPMDGELWIGRGRFDEVSGIVRSTTPDDSAWRRVRFIVFDLPTDPGPFQARVLRMRALLASPGIATVRPVKQFRLTTAAQLDARLAQVVALGGEGLMLHHRHARYRAGRSDGLLKYKPYDDAEARVVGHTPGQGKYTGMLGALVVQRADGAQFRLGSGLSDAERASPPPIGSHVTYRYNGLTGKGLPRFARFLRVRDVMPPPDPQ